MIIMMSITAWSWTVLVGLAFAVRWRLRKAHGSAVGREGQAPMETTGNSHR
jgi:hypothetical protein